MSEKRAKSKLSVILRADAVGYSRLMAEDEDETVRIIAAHRQVMVALIEESGGRLDKSEPLLLDRGGAS